MRFHRRRFLWGAAAAGLCATQSNAVFAAQPRSPLDAIVAEYMSAPQRPRSNSLLFRDTDAVLPDLSVEAADHAATGMRQWIARLKALRDTPLEGDDRDTLEALMWELNTGLEWRRFYWLDSPLSADGSALSVATDRLALAPLRSAAALDGYLAMLEAFPAYVAQIVEKVQGQLTRNIVLHRETIIAVAKQLDRLLASPAGTFVPAPSRLSGISAEAAERFKARATRLVDERIVPALHRLSALLNETYLPRAGEEVGLWRYADGGDYYRFLIGSTTTRDLEPDETHKNALEEVAKADRDLTALRRTMGFQGSAEAFHAQLETGARWKAASTQEVTERFQAALARFKPQYSRFFLEPPATPYDVKPQPPEYNDVMVNGRYQWPTQADPRGAYLFNGGDLDNTSWFWATPLIYHELVPGHHLQLDRVYSSRTLSPFRKSLVFSGPIEGWAEYARRLAVEAGLYENDPMTRYADRLMDRRMAMMAVADTGMHAKRWSLDSAVQYFSTNAITKPSLQRRAMLGIATEYPGFLLSYWAGSDEYARLRRVTESATGSAFDVRRFHEVILSAGVLPFPVLEARLRRHFGGAAKAG